MLRNWQEYAPENRGRPGQRQVQWLKTKLKMEPQTSSWMKMELMGERFSHVWLQRADKLTMVETQSDQFLSHRTSAYIISLLSPPPTHVPPLQHRWSMLAISLQTRVFYLHRARLQKAAVNSTSASPPPGKFMQEPQRKTQTEQKMFECVSRITEFVKDAAKQQRPTSWGRYGAKLKHFI